MISADKIIRILQKKGFFVVRQSGSYIIFKNENGIRITVPHHPKTILHPKIVKSIMRDAELNDDDF
ncbi:MAG: type II toxin-antitoxin system HicA family toxin [Candidatus Aenigmarchaeota archaeon]|nr:type II toxin-antitoxin system HicA family toxin [Candidatus Aenigmarchaeota archaeon]